MSELATYSVYMHTTPNNKRYIGITCQEPKERWGYGCNYRKQPYFSHAIKKYGWGNIKHEVLFTALTREEAEQKERELIAFYNSADRQYGYNIDLGGKSKGRCSEETRRLISKIQIGRKQSPESVRKRALSNTGKKRTEETKRKISESNKKIKRIITPEQRKKMLEGIKNHKWTDEERQRISEGIKASWTPERRKRMSEISKGRKGPTWSDEQIQWFKDHNRGEMSVLSKRVGQFDLEGNLIRTFGSAREAGRNGFTVSGVSAVCRGEKHTHHGYIWKYMEE